MKYKKCTKCGKSKSLSLFGIDIKRKDGFRSDCKVCHNNYIRDYYHTKKGLVFKIYTDQNNNSVRRGHPLPLYTRNQLLDKALESEKFLKLFDEWIKSNYDRWYRPSFDRLDDSKPYTFDNFNCWMTWKENADKGYSDMRSGKIIHGVKPQKAVICVNIVTKEKVEYHSMSEANRVISVDTASISRCCSGKQRQSGGYYWVYKV